MQILNLTFPERSQIKFKISKFPDGQQSVTIEDSVYESEVQISSRLTSFQDLELIICATAALRGKGVTNIHLYAPYFLGARSDRKFTEGGSNYLKDVICPIINAQKFKTVLVLDPHSDVLEACLDNFEKIDNVHIAKHSLNDIGYNLYSNEDHSHKEDLIYLVSPDAGAMKKIYAVAEKFKISNVITAVKHRDPITGKILSTNVPGLPDEVGDTSTMSKNFVIIDDICDGGRTFIELAKAILLKRPRSIYNDKIYLVVSHGIFSAGFVELGKYFDKIYTTNSVKDISKSNDDTDLDLEAKKKVLQFDVF